MSNGDLDGDMFFILADQTLVNDIQCVEPAPPTSSSGPKAQYAPVSFDNLQSQLFKSFVDLRAGDLVGLIDTFWQNAAEIQGTTHPDAITLASLFNDAIDSQKTGKKVEIPRRLRAQYCVRTTTAWHL